jgi:hypothetical protein
MMGAKYNCFQFNEEALFENPVGAAFQQKFEYDKKISNGLNSLDSIRQKIKVRKIQAVKKLEENSYSKEQKYWLNDDSGVVYDYDLSYPVGKISKDDSMNPIMFENSIYIIDNLIDIPKFKLYN